MNQSDYLEVQFIDRSSSLVRSMRKNRPGIAAIEKGNGSKAYSSKKILSAGKKPDNFQFYHPYCVGRRRLQLS